MNSRRQPMSNPEYRIDLTSSSNDLERTETLGEEILHQIESTHPPPPPPTTTAAAGAAVAASLPERTARAGMNDDHLHQIIQFCKDNLTSTFPFALILILKGFDEHSAGQFTLTLSSLSRLGILRVIFFSASISHGNSILVHQASLKVNRLRSSIINRWRRLFFFFFSSRIVINSLFCV